MCDPTISIYGETYGSIGDCPWSSFIDVPRGKEYLYGQMPPMGGYTSKSPAVVTNAQTGHAVEVFYKRGKKKLKRVKLNKDEQREVELDEALETPKKMFKYFKQQNKKKDLAWEEAQLSKYSIGSSRK